MRRPCLAAVPLALAAVLAAAACGGGSTDPPAATSSAAPPRDAQDRVERCARHAGRRRLRGHGRPARPVSVLEVHGTADPIVPYGGVPAFVAGWAQRDGCSSESSLQRAGTAVTTFRWPECRGGAEVQHLRLTGGKHVELLPQLRAAGVDPAATAWRFLRAHRLPAA